MPKVATIVQLEKEQRKKLDKQAKKLKKSRNELVRNAIDRLLDGGLTDEHLQELDMISEEAEKSIKAMMDNVDQMNAGITATIETIEKMRKEAAHGRT